MESTPPRPPSVDRLARDLADAGVSLPHPLLVDIARTAIADGAPGEWAAHAAHLAADRQRSMLQPVVNATGVLLHTNLGRAPLSTITGGRASNLEFDLATGSRGSRTDHAGSLIARAVEADDAIVVNNGAAAVMLVLAALARGEGAAVSRGELVEIGGGFRVPDVMAESGARLVEVGTTNRTRLRDYEAVADDIALVMKVHRSNYTITGFTEETSVAELATLDAPVVVDLGSGLIDTACPWLADGPPPWLAGEPAARQTVADGADLVIFSGDKLLGGPQAGVIAGRADLVRACARHPLYRAFRPGSLVLDAFQDVALAYLDRTAGSLPFWRMATAPLDQLRARAEALHTEAVSSGLPASIIETSAVTGGGTLPGVEIPSVGLAIVGDHAAALRSAPIPVIARVVEGRTVIDVRTVDPVDDGVVRAALGLLA